MEPQQPTDWISKLTPLGITGIISLIIGVALERFKGRLTILKYSISFQPLATSSQTDNWGVIEVYHNGRLIRHLNFVTIEIENSSNTDLQSVAVDVSCDTNSQFLAQSGFYNEGNGAIVLGQNHFNYHVDVLQRNSDDMAAKEADPNHVTPQQLVNEINWVQSNKKFFLPVFNRHTKITLNLLVENFQGLIPIVNVSVLHKSVQVIKASDSDTELKKGLFWTIGIGLTIFITGLIFLLNHYSLNKMPVILTATLGLLYSLVGLAIYLLFRFIKRLFF